MAPAIRAGWALFDPDVITGEDVIAAGPTATCDTSDGHDVRVSLRLADPPAASFVEMVTDAELWDDTPTVVAADGDLLLIHAILAVRDDMRSFSLYQEHNFFVYKAHPSSPSLRLIRHPQGWDLYTGIIARRRPDVEEEEEFVVAVFHRELIGFGWDKEPNDEVGKLTRFSSSTGQCEVLKLPIPFDPSKGLYKSTWETDKVVSVGGDLMCFVDYHRGILLCDVFATGGGSPELRFVPLPEIDIWDDTHDYCNGRGLPEEYRTVDVSNGVMKFVEVSDGLFGRRRNPFAVTITTWTLKMTMEDDMGWEKDGVLRLEDLWSFPEFRRSGMPRWRPGIPAVCRHDADVVQFALLDPKCKFTMEKENAWVIMVDVRKMELLAYEPYTNQAKAKGDDEDDGEYEVVVGCLFHDTPFICSDLYN